MGFLDRLNTAFEFIQDVGEGVAMGSLVLMDRDSAMQKIAGVVQSYTPHQLDQYEQTFLSATSGLILPTQRIRAMELYAYLKVLETLRYQQWRGFSPMTETRALC